MNTVESTEPVPHMGLSASPELPEAVVEAVRKALLDASSNESGRKMLEALRIESFQPADAATYDGYADLLEGVFGY